MDEKLEVSRRNVLLGVGTAGVAAAGAGLGTTAYLNDSESFSGNEVSAGTLDVVVDYESAVDQAGAATGSTTGSDRIDGDPATGEYVIEDVKPGDSGSLLFCPKVVDNPAWLFVGSGGPVGQENGQTEPESAVDYTAGGPDNGVGAGELAEAIEVTVSYAQADGTVVRELNDPPWYTLRDLLSDLTSGFRVDGDAGTSGTREAYPASDGPDDQQGPCLLIEWEVPTDVGNEIQSDSVAFDVQFYGVQRRHNPDATNPFVDAVVSQGGGGDFGSIQAAVNAVGEGGTVLVEDGTYREQVVVGYDDLTLEGQSRDGVEIKLPSSPTNVPGGNGPEVLSVHPAAAAASGVTGGDASLLNEPWWRSSRGHYEVTGVSIRNLTVDGNGQASNRGLYFAHAQSYNVDNVVSRNNGDKGCGNGWSRNGRFTSCTFENNVDDGITIFRSDGYTLRNVTVDSNGDDGIDVHGNGHTVIDCTAIDNGTIERGAGVEFTQGEHNSVLESDVTGNDVGIYVENVGSASATPSPGDVEILATHNDVAGNATGLEVDSGNDDVTVDANDNWWGAADGPSGDFSGSGDPAIVISGTGATLLLSTWLTAPYDGGVVS